MRQLRLTVRWVSTFAGVLVMSTSSEFLPSVDRRLRFLKSADPLGQHLPVTGPPQAQRDPSPTALSVCHRLTAPRAIGSYVAANLANGLLEAGRWEECGRLTGSSWPATAGARPSCWLAGVGSSPGRVTSQRPGTSWTGRCN